MHTIIIHHFVALFNYCNLICRSSQQLRRKLDIRMLISGAKCVFLLFRGLLRWTIRLSSIVCWFAQVTMDSSAPRAQITTFARTRSSCWSRWRTTRPRLFKIVLPDRRVSRCPSAAALSILTAIVHRLRFGLQRSGPVVFTPSHAALCALRHVSMTVFIVARPVRPKTTSLDPAFMQPMNQAAVGARTAPCVTRPGLM